MSSADVFISYSHEDKVWKERVVKFMNVMKQADRFNYSSWHDREIDLGKHWPEEINAAIDQATVALLLISADFLQSPFILEHEVPKFKEREKNGELVLIPLLLRPCPWQFFDWLSPIQGYLQEDKILSGCNSHETESILNNLVQEIDRIISDMQTSPEEDAISESLSAAIISQIKDTTTKQRGFEEPEREGPSKDSVGFLTNTGVVNLIETSPRNPSGENVVGLIQIFKTRTQRTWFAVTASNLFCVLDSQKTASTARQLQWVLPLGKAAPVNIKKRRISARKKAAGLVDVGPKQNWLYSLKIHPDPELLKKQIEELIDIGKRS